MAIPTNCKCGFSFAAKDNLAGKKVKCPRCQSVIQVPTTAAVGATSTGATGGQVNKKLLDLLDDAGVKSTPTGPICAACGTEMDPTAVICIECGYNVATGQYLDTYTEEEDAEQLENSGLTDAEKAMAKAEQEIEENPIGAEDQDFGDGADSYIIAMAGFAIFAVLVLMGLAVVLVMESLTESVNTGMISAIASSMIYVAGAIWISIVAFRTKAAHGIGCVLSAGLYCPVYGLMRGRGTIAISVIMIVAAVVGVASWIYLSNSGEG
ncbi:MAG: hypothetical protein ACR2NP_03885 [Pirellulaceae bacterium]